MKTLLAEKSACLISPSDIQSGWNERYLAELLLNTPGENILLLKAKAPRVGATPS